MTEARVVPPLMAMGFDDWRAKHNHGIGETDCDKRAVCRGCADRRDPLFLCEPGACGTPEAKRGHRPGDNPSFPASWALATLKGLALGDEDQDGAEWLV